MTSYGVVERVNIGDGGEALQGDLGIAPRSEKKWG